MDDSAAATERIVDSFGGIRPMAAKLDTPVTTVQGWKKRGIIPQARHADILAAAARENITIESAELAQTDPGGGVARPVETASPAQPPLPHPAAVGSGRNRAGGVALALSVLVLLAVAAGGAAAWEFYLQPLEARVAQLESRAGASTSEDAHARDVLLQRVSKLEADVAHSPAAAAGPAGTGPESQITAIQQQLTELKASTGSAEQLAKRLSELQVAAGGRELLAQSIRDIQSSAAATQGEVDRLKTQLTALSPKLDQIEASLADRRQQALRAEAVFLAAGQLRSALKDSKPFAKEVAGVRAVTAGDADMTSLLDQLQPFADEGVPTEDGLERELARLAPEIVRSAIVGNGQSWWRQALYHMSAIVSIRRVGATVPGDEADALVARAQGKLEQDDLHGAVATLQGLTGLPAEIAAPWLRDANNRIAVDSAEGEMTRLAIERISAGAPSAAPAASQPPTSGQ